MLFCMLVYCEMRIGNFLLFTSMKVHGEFRLTLCINRKLCVEDLAQVRYVPVYRFVVQRSET